MIDNLTTIIVLLMLMNIITIFAVIGSAIAHLHIAKAHHNGDIELLIERLIDKTSQDVVGGNNG